MRVIVFFDLPTLTLEDKKEYRNFRKFLLKRGFAMMQEQVGIKYDSSEWYCSKCKRT